jgi:hypothetical protein
MTFVCLCPVGTNWIVLPPYPQDATPRAFEALAVGALFVDALPSLLTSRCLLSDTQFVASAFQLLSV